MIRSRTLRNETRTLLALFTAALVAVQCRAAERRDPIADELARWTAFADSNRSEDELWLDVKRSSAPALAATSDALRHGWRYLALHRLAGPRTNLAASRYVIERPAIERENDSAFAVEWKRMSDVLAQDLRVPSPGALAGARPAVVRAIGEAALPQARIFHEASLEYGRSTMPLYGLFYLGSALAQRDFAAFSRGLDEPSAGRAPPLRALGPELDALEADLLATYRPPASIDRHPEFIAASSLQKEARALDHAGLRYGALLRYLQAAQRLVPLESAVPPAPDSARLAADLGVFAERLAEGGVDHTIGRLFVESALADLDGPAPDTSDANAFAIVTGVLPRYFAALGPAPPAPTPVAPLVTVTLVRWPFT